VAGNVGGEIRAEPNLTPLLDVVFQLITFFMLVINFSADNYDVRVRLPVAATAMPPEPGKALDEQRLVFNIDKAGRLLINGQELDTEKAIKEIHTLAVIEKSATERARKRKGLEFKATDPLPTTIVFRCDRDTSFADFFRLMNACQREGFQTYSFKAMTSEN
jgi:biopolymer transport protein ExbD